MNLLMVPRKTATRYLMAGGVITTLIYLLMVPYQSGDALASMKSLTKGYGQGNTPPPSAGGAQDISAVVVHPYETVAPSPNNNLENSQGAPDNFLDPIGEPIDTSKGGHLKTDPHHSHTPTKTDPSVKTPAEGALKADETSQHVQSDATETPEPTHFPLPELASLDTKRRDYLKSVFRVFDDYHPEYEPLKTYKDESRPPTKAFDDKLPIFTTKELGEYLQVGDETKEVLKDAHAKVVAALPDNPPDGIFNGTGVVFTSGGVYLPTMVTSLRMLRRVSPVIPVEVFLADDTEYEPVICEEVLPSLGARCVVLTQIYGEKFFKDFDIRGYQLKALAVVASSFDDVIFLDSDNMAIYNVEASIQQEPYLSYGYVLWPDYWFRTTSPHYFDIAGINLGERVRGDLSITDLDQVPMADRRNALPDKSSESGQLMVAKTRHFKSLLLSVFYNLHGYSAFYPLLTQGIAGEGDKETFLAAALAVNDTVYQVLSGTRPVGRFTSDNRYMGAGMMQRVPIDDYEYHVTKTREAEPRVMLMHFNMYKMNLKSLFWGDEEAHFIDDESRIRYWGNPADNVGAFDYRDLELLAWQEALWTACEMPKLFNATFRDWVHIDQKELCSKAEAHYDWLVRTHA